MLTVAQVAARLACSESNVYALLKARKLIATPVGAKGGGLRVTEADLEAFLASRRREGHQSPRGGVPTPRADGWRGDIDRESQRAREGAR